MGQTSGYVKTAGGDPQEFITVTFRRTGGGTYTDQTDANGFYSLFLPVGTYTAYDGTDPLDPPNFPIAAGAKVQNLTK